MQAGNVLDPSPFKAVLVTQALSNSLDCCRAGLALAVANSPAAIALIVKDVDDITATK
jgi:hypothetical protein